MKKILLSAIVAIALQAQSAAQQPAQSTTDQTAIQQELEQLRQENLALKNELSKLKERENDAGIGFIDFGKAIQEHEQAMQEHEQTINALRQMALDNFSDMDEMINISLEKSNKALSADDADDSANTPHKYFASNQSSSRYFSTGDIVSKMSFSARINDDKSTQKAEFKTYNTKSDKIYGIDDIFADKAALTKRLSSTAQSASAQHSSSSDDGGVRLENFYLDGYGFWFFDDGLKHSAKLSYEQAKDLIKPDFAELLGLEQNK